MAIRTIREETCQECGGSASRWDGFRCVSCGGTGLRPTFRLPTPEELIAHIIARGLRDVLAWELSRAVGEGPDRRCRNIIEIIGGGTAECVLAESHHGPCFPGFEPRMRK